MNDISLSIIIPCFNEEKNLKREIFLQIKRYLVKQDFKWEVIISDDGSTDKSLEIIRSQIKGWKNFRVLANEHGGKPTALWNGIKAAKGNYVLFTDLDQSTPIQELTKLLPFLDKNVGAVIGSRGLVRKNFPVYRRMGSIIFMSFRKLFILPEIDDTQCGFKLFRKSVVAKAFPHLQYFSSGKKAVGWSVSSFDVELLHIVKKMGYKIEEVPVIWSDSDESESKGGGMSRYLNESKEMLLQIYRVKANELNGFYKDL